MVKLTEVFDEISKIKKIPKEELNRLWNKLPQNIRKKIEIGTAILPYEFLPVVALGIFDILENPAKAFSDIVTLSPFILPAYSLRSVMHIDKILEKYKNKNKLKEVV